MAVNISTREWEIYQMLLQYCIDKNISPLSEIDNEISKATKDNDTYIVGMYTGIRNYHIATGNEPNVYLVVNCDKKENRYYSGNESRPFALTTSFAKRFYGDSGNARAIEICKQLPGKNKVFKLY